MEKEEKCLVRNFPAVGRIQTYLILSHLILEMLIICKFFKLTLPSLFPVNQDCM